MFINNKMLEWITALFYGSLQGLCNVVEALKAHALTKAWYVRKLPGKRTMDIATMLAHTAGHDATCHIIYIFMLWIRSSLLSLFC